MGGFFANFNYAQTHTRSGENRTFTADASTNHIWTMTKTGADYDDFDLTVSLNKAKFRNIGTNTNEFGFGLAAIPANWDFTITSAKDESNNNLAVNGKSFKYTNNPTQTITVLVRVFNTDDNSTIATDARITYYLISPLTTGNSFNSCTQAQEFTISEVTMGAQKPCENSYRLVITSTATGNVVYDQVQTNSKYSVTGLAVGNYSYVITDGCTNAALANVPGRTLNGVFSVQNAAELGTSKVFAGKLCAADATGVAVLRIRGAKKDITWVLSTLNDQGTPGDSTDDTIIANIVTNGDTNRFTTDGDTPAATDANYTLTINGLAPGLYRFVFTDANGCVKSLDFTVDDTDAMQHDLINLESILQVSCPGDNDGKLVFRGFGGYTQNDDDSFKDDPYIFTLINLADPTTPITVTSAVDLAGTNPDGYKAIFDGLPPGNYKLKMKEIMALNTDASAGNQEIFCEIEFPDTYTIQVADPIILNETISDIACFGTPDGNIDITITGGKPFAAGHPDNTVGRNGAETGYNIVWNTAVIGNTDFLVNTDDQLNLKKGGYTITITDANGCQVIKNYSIDEPTALDVTINNPADLSCFGDNNGQITATIDAVNFGQGPYVYSILGNTIDGNPNTFPPSAETPNLTHTFNNLTASDGAGYTVRVTDANGCTDDSAAEAIGQPANGMSMTAKIIADFNGGQNPDGSAHGFPHGDGVHMKCNGQTNGQIDLNVTGGSVAGDYTYSWTTFLASDPAGLDKNAGDQTGLPAGVYQVTVSDDSGCSITRRYVISEPAPLTIPSADITNATGYTALPDFGGNKYYLSTESVTYMEARDKAAELGGYLVAVNSDAENQMLIAANTPSNFWIGADDIVTESKDNDNSNELWAGYRWNDGTLLTAVSNNSYQSFNGGEPNDNDRGDLNSGSFGLGEDYIEFQNGNWNDIYHDSKRRYVIEFNPSAIPDNNGTTIKCFGGNTGDSEGIDFIVTGGTLPYTYAWTASNGGAVPAGTANNQNLRNLVAGDYKIDVTDAEGCTVSKTYTITQPPELVVSKVEAAVNPLVCFDDTTTITANIDTESIVGGTYKFELIGRDYNNTDVTLDAASTVSKVGTSHTFTVKANLDTTTYTVRITDANDCFKDIVFTEIDQPAAGLSFQSETVKTYNKYPAGAADDIHISCFGGSDGEIAVTIAGGTVAGDYTYTWTQENGASGIVAGDNESQTGLTSGKYTLEVTDDSGVCKITRTWTLNQPAAALDIVENIRDFNGKQISCNDKTDGRIELNITGGTKFIGGANADSYEFTWTAAANVDGDVGVIPAGKTNASLLENIPAGRYTVVVKDANNCQSTESYEITKPPVLTETNTIPLINGFNITCSGGNDGSIDVTPAGGTVAGNYTYTWTQSLGASGIVAGDNGTQTGLTAGTYDLRITDDNGCFIDRQFILTQPTGLTFTTVDVKKYNQFGAGAANEVNISCNGLADGEIDLTQIDGGVLRDNGSYKYTWTQSNGGSGLVTNDDTVSKQTGLTAGTYTVVVTDKSDVCSITRTWTLLQPDALDIVEDIKDWNDGNEISCNGANDGDIKLNVSGGTKFSNGVNANTYQFTWSASNGGVLDAGKINSPNQDNLRPGRYTVVVKDANGCEKTEFYDISEPDPLALTQTLSAFDGGFNVTCSSATNGEIDITVSGGTTKVGNPNYDYSWTGPNGFTSTSEDVENLSAGTYKVVVTDRNNCSIEQSFQIIPPPPIVVTATIKDHNATGFNISCNGLADGEIDISPSGGNRNIVGGIQNDYTYLWEIVSGGVGANLVTNVADQTGLTAGFYKVTVTDDNGCTDIQTHEIKEPEVLDFTGTMSDYNTFQISIAGEDDGTITINSTSGPDNKFGGASDTNKEYTYEWSTLDGSGLVAGEMNQLALTKGTYTLKITDSNLCDVSKTFVLTEPVELLIDLETSFLNIPCFGDSSGVLTGKITQAAVSPYTYTLKGTDYTGAAVEEIISSTNALSHTFSVKAGVYNITVVDLNGATKVSANRTFTNPANPLAITEVISSHNAHNITCNGASDGSIDATASGGTLNGGQYNYSWTAKDENGVAFLLPDPNNKKQDDLGPGDYTVLVRDQNLCEITKTYTLTEPQAIVFQNVSKNDITCFGDNDGAIEINVTEGTGNYIFVWSTVDGSGLKVGDTTNPTGLGPGTYKLELSDGCENLTFNYVIAEPAVLAITLDQKTDILCFGDNTGQLLVTVSGGNSPYGYEWEDDKGNKYSRDVGNVFNKGDLSNIPSGTYKLKVTDRLGCVANLNNVVVAEPTELVIGIAKTDLNCSSLDNGSITVTPSGGVAPYTYTWSDLGNGPNRKDLAAGTYTVKVTDNNLCEKSVDVVIADAPLFTIVPVVTPITCFGADDGTISLNLQGGTGNVNVLWTDDATAGVNRTKLKAGSYNVVLTDDAGCTIDRIIQITEPRELSLSAVITDALDCVDPLTGGIDLQIVGGTAPYSILWSTGETSEDLTSIGANNYSVTVTDFRGCTVVQSFVIKRPPALAVTMDTSSRIVCATKEVFQVNKLNISGGTFPYTVTWSDGTVLGNGESMETKKEGSYQVTVTDKLLCSVNILFDVVLPKLGAPEFDYTSDYFTQFNAYTYNDPITFTNQSTENFLSVEWDFGDGTTSTLNNPVHTYSKSGSYDVTLYVTYIGGCLYSLTKTIYVGDSFEIEIPNAFTPNSDGINDAFRPVYFGFTEITLKVFDTWGTLIFIEEATTGNLKGWNGNIQGVGAENGNYIYQVTGKAFNGDLFSKNGPFTLIR